MKEPESGVRELLKKWVPQDQWDIYDLHGYHVKDIEELGARVISINTESCDYRNDFLWAQLADPNGQIAFLERNLAELESKGQKAILMGHIPDDCSHQYADRFRALLVRYQKTVRLSMFGHTHTDIFKSVLSFETNQPVGVLTVCGSMTTWGGLNPSFCVYELDKETLLPVTR